MARRFGGGADVFVGVLGSLQQETAQACAALGGGGAPAEL